MSLDDRIKLAEAAIDETTIDYSEWIKRVSMGYKGKPYAYETTAWHRTFMAAAPTKNAWLELLDAAKTDEPVPPLPGPEPEPEPPKPTPVTTDGLGLLVYGGKMRTVVPDHSHYDFAISNWADIGTHRYCSMVSVSRIGWTGVDSATADAHDDWYLRLADGSYAVNVNYPTNRMADPGHQGYRDEWAKQVIEKMTTGAPGCRGVFVDDSVANPVGLMASMPTKYPDRTSWRAAVVGFFQSVVPKLNAAGLEVIANSLNFIAGDANSNTPANDLDWYRQLVPHINGLSRERWQQRGIDGGLMYYDEPVPASFMAHFSEWLEVPTLVQSLGKAFYCIFTPADTPSNARFARGAFLLRWNGTSGGMVYAAKGYIPTADPWDAEWTRSLGKPTGAAVKAGVCWSRAFTGGRLIVNPTRAAAVADGLAVPAQDSLFLAS